MLGVTKASIRARTPTIKHRQKMEDLNAHCQPVCDRPVAALAACASGSGALAQRNTIGATDTEIKIATSCL
jgi:hypothetical protein